MLKFKSLLIVLMSLAFVATACDKQQVADAEEPATGEEAKEAVAEEVEGEADKADEADEAAEGDKAEEKALAQVEVPKEGKKFDPVVEAEQMPAGAWYCDMGTVHYASMDKGDGSCPECGMKLKQKAGGDEAAGEKAAEVDPHAGHNHD
jgi:hypothetical protein